MKVHEFWLKAGQEKYGWDPNETLPIYRVALGKLIDATQRTTFPPPPDSKSPNFWNKSGSIGFMDLRVDTRRVPREGAQPLPNPNQSPYLEQEYPWQDLEERKALIIETIGIEPEHRRQGHARFLKRRAEEIASEWGLDTIVAEEIQNPIMQALNVKLGYTLYDVGGINAVKRLTSS